MGFPGTIARVRNPCRGLSNLKITAIMPIIKAAKKDLKSSAKKRVFNDRRRRKVKSVVKSIEKLVSGGKKDEAKKMLPEAYKAIDKATKRGVLKKNTASRNKAKLSRMTK